MNTLTPIKNLIEPKESYLLLIYTPDAFKYREHREPDGTTKIYKINPLKKVFAQRFREKYKEFIDEYEIKKVEGKQAIYYLPDVDTGKQFIEYISGLKEVILQELLTKIEKANKNKDIPTAESIQKEINYLNKHWERNKPIAQIIKALVVD